MSGLCALSITSADVERRLSCELGSAIKVNKVIKVSGTL